MMAGAKASVEADHSGPQAVAHRQAAGEVAGIDVGHQSHLGSVGRGDHQVAKSRKSSLEWMASLEWMDKTGPAGMTNDSGLRRPLWYARPLNPTLDAYRLPDA